MRCSLLISVMCLASFLASGQSSSTQTPTPAPKATGQKPAAPPAKSASTKPKSTDSKEVGPDEAVITIEGLCATAEPKSAASKTTTAPAAAKPCKTVVTRKQLELVIDTVKPNLLPAQRRMLAQQYAELLVMANAGEKAGLGKTPKVQEQIRIQKLQVLASAYTRELQQKGADVPEADIEKYYKENASKYEQAKLLRIYIPMVVTEEGKPPDQAATKALAEKIQQRAAAGEDFDALQKEAFAAASNKGTPPSADLGERRHGSLPPRQEGTVFGLKVGEVSLALEEGSGFYIYKMVGRDEVPLDKVHEEIKGTLSRERLRESLEKVRASATPVLNDAYFVTPSAPPAAGETAAPAAVPPSAPSPQTPAAGPAQPATAAPPAAPAGTPEAPNAPPPAPPQSK